MLLVGAAFAEGRRFVMGLIVRHSATECSPGIRPQPVGRWYLSGSDTNEAALREERTVLVVEDNHGLRTLVTKALEGRGYRVLSCPASEDALRLFDQESVHLLLTDVVLAGLDGIALARRLRARQPALRVLLMSGHSEKDVVAPEVLESGVSFLSKPFRVADLVHTVSRSLRELD